ncbi:MAG TPA: hypothetical protein VKL40_07810 [Candidatus Angelobacter sp.]|nr:hypothetical protein [Candidatus Angelobacter sp.]
MRLSAMEWASVGLAMACIAIQAAILWFLYRGKRRSEFPIFRTYSATYILLLLISLSAYVIPGCDQSTRYTYVYWTVSIVYMSVEFAVMYEIIVNALKPYSALVDLGRMLFIWAAVFLLIAAGTTAFATSGPESGRLQAAFAVVERSMRLMECGLLLLFFFFERRLGLSWRNPNVGIAIGLGITASVDLICSYLQSRFPAQALQVGMVNTSAYAGVLAFWCYLLVADRAETKSAVSPPSRLILQRWNEALAGYRSNGAAAATNTSSIESFLPGIEKTVDRVLARKIAN